MKNQYNKTVVACFVGYIYRVSMILAHVFAAAELLLLTVLPELQPNPFVGILRKENTAIRSNWIDS